MSGYEAGLNADAIGRLFIVGIPAPQLDSATERILERLGVGGVILFRRNVETPAQIAALTVAIHALPSHPLVAIDHEGGRVMRLAEPFTPFPPAAAVGRTGDPDLAFRVGYAMAEELASVGIDLNFAPVLDVHSNPANPIIGDRAFGSDPALVAELGVALMRGLLAGGVIPCGKHFPGHGEAGLDSHSALPAIDKDRDSLEEEDMLPFRRAAMAGIEMMMTAHLKVPALDPAYPASLSQLITRGYLRNRSRFEGIILTDALSMSALTAHYSVRDAARLAIKAGADILLHPADPFVLLDALSDLARTKEVTKEDAMASASRLQRAKAKYCLGAKLTDRQMAERLAKNAETAQAIARRALTLVKAAGAFPALKDVKGGVAHVVLEDDNDPKAGRALRSALARHKNVRNFFVTRKKAAVMRQEVMSGTRGAALTIISIFSKVSAGKGTSGLSQELMELGRQLVVKGKKKAVVSFGSPYILKNFMDAEYVVAAYDPGEAMQGAAYRAFLGEIVFMGELPVRI